MKVLKKKFSKGTIMIFLSINWAVLIIISSILLKDLNDQNTNIIMTLVVGFTLQMSFLNDQLLDRKKQ